MNDYMSDASSDESDVIIVAATRPSITAQTSRHVPQSNVFSHFPLVNRLRYLDNPSIESTPNPPGCQCLACGPLHSENLGRNTVSVTGLRRISQVCKLCNVVLQAITFHHPGVLGVLRLRILPRVLPVPPTKETGRKR